MLSLTRLRHTTMVVPALWRTVPMSATEIPQLAAQSCHPSKPTARGVFATVRNYASPRRRMVTGAPERESSGPKGMSKQDKSRIWKLLAAGFVFTTVMVGGYVYTDNTRVLYENNDAPDYYEAPRTQKEYTAIWQRIAQQAYDDRIWFEEWMILLPWRRKAIVSKARGKVLEVSAGTGRNLDYYKTDGSVESLTLTDLVPEMLKACEEKIVTQKLPFPVKCEIADSQKLPYENDSFDSVVQTFGLCSYPKPVLALREMARVCKAGGKILLLEHGESNWDRTAREQLKRQFKHASFWGCYNNRPIDKLVQQAGLKILNIKRYQKGTVYLIEIENR
eukprot:Clim_evm5s20 gene=Clim_evmTU5s20